MCTWTATCTRFFLSKVQIHTYFSWFFHVKICLTCKFFRSKWKFEFKRFFYLSKILLQKVIEKILIKQVLWLVKDSFTENYRINLDQKGSFTRQRFFYRKLSNKSWSNRFFYSSKILYRKLLKQSWSKGFFYMSKVLLQNIIEEILIKKVLLLVKGSFTENYQRNLDQKGSFTHQRFFYRKLSNKSWSKRFFYSSKVLLQKVI